MGSFLDRYRRGEHEQVWDELVALGAAVRDKPVYTDALAVAHETMQRARRNIELLIPRLVAVGYQFGYGWLQPYVRERLLRPYRVDYQGRYNELVEPAIPDHYAYRYRMAYAEYLERAQAMPSPFTSATDRDEHVAYLETSIARTAPAQTVFREQLRAMQDELRAQPSAQERVAQVEALLGTLPLSVRAWYEEVGGVNFVGDHPGWRALLPEDASPPPMSETDYVHPMRVLDPLLVYPLDEANLAQIQERVQRVERDQAEHWLRSFLDLAPNAWMKYLDNATSGGSSVLQVSLPALGADARCAVPGTQMFVAYLRECFRWGGFPGWAKLEKRPEQDLAFLTQDLLPI